MKIGTRDLTAFLAGLAALGVVAYGLTAQYGWIETVFLWQVHLFGLLMIGVSVSKGFSKLLLVLLPVFIVPLGTGAMLLYECSRGNCL